MKFGKEFKIHLEETLPEWRDKFLCYKPLKKLLKNLNNQEASPAFDLHHLQHWFLRILNDELRKFNYFYVNKEEEFVICLQELKERIGLIKEKSSKDGVFTSESEFSEDMMDIRRDLVTIHGMMVLLINYSSLNFAGLIKILKKYDKRTGGLLCLPFTQLALRQPFFNTEPLTRLVHECEANLELLLPLEAEVVQSRNHETQDVSNPPLSTTANLSAESPANLGEETMDIYRSTIAAMRAIRGLQKPSSTCNPLSFSSLYESKDDEITGAVTAENSPSNSPTALQDEDDSNEDYAPSV